jgi:hypothetical protein
MENCTDELLYLAANAPTEIPSWYQPAFKGLEHPPRPPIPEEFNDALKKWEHDSSYKWSTPFENVDSIAAAHADALQAAMETWRSEIYRREEARQVARYFAWRWYWADQMLAHRTLASVPRRDKL